MLTSYFVRCPHAKCAWAGSLIPDDEQSAATVLFECPQCRQQWRAEIVGEDVRPIGVAVSAPARRQPQPVGW